MENENEYKKEVADNKKMQKDYYSHIFGENVRPEGYELAHKMQDEMYKDIIWAIDDLGMTEQDAAEMERNRRIRNSIITFFLLALNIFENGIKREFNKNKSYPVIKKCPTPHKNFQAVLDELKKQIDDTSYPYCERILTVHYSDFCEYIRTLLRPEDIALANMLLTHYRLYMLEITEHLKRTAPRKKD